MSGISIKTILAVSMLAFLMGSLYYTKNELDKAKLTIENKIATIGSKDLIIDSQSINIKELNDTITNLTSKYKAYEAEVVKSKEKLASWRAKPTKIKYINVTKLSGVTKQEKENDICSYGLKLNKTISELDYDSL